MGIRCYICHLKFETLSIVNDHQRNIHTVEELSVALLASQGHLIPEVETETFNDIIVETSSNDETSSNITEQKSPGVALQNEQGYVLLSQIETETIDGNIGTSLYNNTQKSAAIERKENEVLDVNHRENCNICTKTYRDLCRKGLIACSRCLRCFSSRTELSKHNCLLKDYIFSVCPVCNIEFLTLGACTEHFYLAHPNYHKPDSFNRCTYCDQIFLGGLTFHIHLDNHVYNM